jgi:sortase (surface protein transpeptidase)
MLRRLLGIALMAAGVSVAVWQPQPSRPRVAVSRVNLAVVPDGVVSPSAGPPLRLGIPRLAIDAAVEPVGVEADNTMGVPGSVRDVGWLSSGTTPGMPGNAVVDGHVDDVFGRPAVFWTLSRLQPGDVITVQSSGARLLFVVTAVVRYPLAAFPRGDVFGPSPLARLNLITCAGTWDRWRRVYSQRLVVYSRLLKILGQRPGWRPV